MKKTFPVKVSKPIEIDFLVESIGNCQLIKPDSNQKYIIKSGIENYLIIRFGFIYSKMSQKHDPAPFAIEKSDAAKFIIKSLSNNKNLIYYPKVLFIISLIFRIVPSSFLDKIEIK